MSKPAAGQSCQVTLDGNFSRFFLGGITELYESYIKALSECFFLLGHEVVGKKLRTR